jgi:hypothetical protein
MLGTTSPTPAGPTQAGSIQEASQSPSTHISAATIGAIVGSIVGICLLLGGTIAFYFIHFQRKERSLLRDESPAPRMVAIQSFDETPSAWGSRYANSSTDSY